jgi:membrane protease YdiL (CAAX protease family)
MTAGDIMKSSAYLTILASILSLATISSADETTVPLLYELLPGGTHFYSGDHGKGTAFLAAELSLFAAGIVIEPKTDNEFNIPFVLAGQTYAIDKCDYSLHRLAHFLESEGAAKNIASDSSPLRSLMTAPFRRETVLTRFVLSFAALGIIDSIVAYPDRNSTYCDIRKVRAYGSSWSRGDGSAVYESSALALSWGAAVSEEMLFRGLLLPALDSRYGRRTGLIGSSLVFGLMHLMNTDIDRPAYFIGQATAAGFAFGYNVQRNDYRLNQAIAAHFWYNVVSMTTTWLLNPKENPLGFEVRIGF